MIEAKHNEVDWGNLEPGAVVNTEIGTWYFKKPGRTIWVDGSEEWLNDKLEWHREDGPARIRYDGTLEYWINGKRHRDGGPAIIWPGKQEWWFEHGKCHRIDGPARITANGDKEWVLYGQKYSEAEFNERVKCMKK